MKKIIVSSSFLLLAVTLFAQPDPRGRSERPGLTERWKRDSIRLQLYVNISSSQAAIVKPVFLDFYKGLDSFAKPGQASPPAAGLIEKILNQRMETLKKILDVAQMERFETFEREFMPPPPSPGSSTPVL